MVDSGHPQPSRTLQIQRAVVNEEAFLRRALRDFQGNAKNGFLGLSRVQVTRAEEDQEVFSQMKSFDAVLVKLQRLVVDGAYKVFFRVRYFVENRPCFRIFFGLRKHEGREYLARERAGPIEQGAVEILVQRDLPGVERWEREIMPVLELFQIEPKRSGRRFAGFAIPAVG